MRGWLFLKADLYPDIDFIILYLVFCDNGMIFSHRLSTKYHRITEYHRIVRKKTKIIKIS